MSWTHCGFSQGFFFKSGVAFALKNCVRTSAAICRTRWWFARVGVLVDLLLRASQLHLVGNDADEQGDEEREE